MTHFGVAAQTAGGYNLVVRTESELVTRIGLETDSAVVDAAREIYGDVTNRKPGLCDRWQD